MDDQAEVTRCVCGNDELSNTSTDLLQFLLHEYSLKVDTGLFIQCDKCLVWQHGYCVGLFVDSDVPDKYWCEQCKHDLHRFIAAPDGSFSRTLYRPVNDDRKKLLVFSELGQDRVSSDEGRAENKLTRLRLRRSPTALASGTENHNSDALLPTSNRQSRKDRRHGDDAFDEQLQRALRESAKTSTERKRTGDVSPSSGEKRPLSEDLDNDAADAHEDDLDKPTVKREPRARKAQPKPKPKPKPAKKQADEALTRDGLLREPSKPRFVNDKSTIYELRKRTGAILEWLGRSQMELEEERDVKALQFSEANSDKNPLVPLVNENLKLMENLTEKILLWEQKFGKYAP